MDYKIAGPKENWYSARVKLGQEREVLTADVQILSFYFEIAIPHIFPLVFNLYLVNYPAS